MQRGKVKGTVLKRENISRRFYEEDIVYYKKGKEFRRNSFREYHNIGEFLLNDQSVVGHPYFDAFYPAFLPFCLLNLGLYVTLDRTEDSLIFLPLNLFLYSFVIRKPSSIELQAYKKYKELRSLESIID